MKYFAGKPISKKMIIIPTALFLAAVGVYYLWRDFNLSNIKRIPVPDIVVNNIEIEREIDGKLWHLTSPMVEHKDGLLNGRSLDVTITEKSGKVTAIFAERGIFTRSNEDLTLFNANAEMRENDKKYNLKSGHVEYVSKTEFWTFTDNITLTDGKMTVEGSEGTFDGRSGSCRLPKGGTITWMDQ